MADDDLEITLPSETPPAEAAKEPLEPPKAPPETDPEAAIAQFKAQVEEHKRLAAQERQARLDAEKRAREYAVSAEKAQYSAQDGQLAAISNALRAVSADLDAAERASAEALAAGDTAMAAKAQRAMVEAQSYLRDLERGKSALEQQIESQKKAAETQPKYERPQRDPIDEWADSLTSASRDWVLRHRDQVQDPNTMRKIGAAHQYAVEVEGIRPDTSEYFEFIESRIGLRPKETPPAYEPKTEPQPTETQSSSRKPMPAAPVANSPAPGSRGGKSITLTKEMRDTAYALYPHLPKAEAEAVYAKDRARLIAEGRL